MSVETPDYLVGVGGGGSRIVERFMQKEWIIEDLVRQEADNGEIRLHARTIDSATSQGERDARQRAGDHIIDLIKSKRHEHGLPNLESLRLSGFSSLSFEHYNYVADTAEGMFSPERILTSEADVEQRIFPGTERLDNCWWLTDDSELLTDGFNNGTERRRALGKALYHVSAGHASNPVAHPANLNVGAGDEVVMVVALGGGTGSGSFIDIAVDMDDNAAIDLFAVVPDAGHARGHSEGRDELANAYAALSELEYMQINGESPFRTVTLLPYLTQEDIRDSDFEEAAVHSILAHQGAISDGVEYVLVPGRDNAIAPYHTFNVAVPRIIQYDASARTQAVENVEAYLDERRKQLEVEAGLYETTEAFLREQFPDSFGAAIAEPADYHPVRTDAVHTMARRLEEQLQGSLLADETLRVAGLGDAVDEIEDAIETVYASQFDAVERVDDEKPVYERVEQRDRADTEYAEEVVVQLSNQLPDLIEVDQFDGDDERAFATLVLQELENVESRYRLLQAIETAEPEQFEILGPQQVEYIKTALTDVVLDPEARNLLSVFPNEEIEEIQNDLRPKIYEEELPRVQMEQFEAIVAEDLQDRLAAWVETVTDELELITTYSRRRDELEAMLADLNEVCEQKAEVLSDEDIPAQVIGTGLETRDGKTVNLQSLEQLLEQFDIEIDRSGLNTDIKNLIQAKKAHEEHHSGGLFGVFDDSPEDEFRDVREAVNFHDRFEITADIYNTFNVEFQKEYKGLIDDIERRHEEAVDTVVAELERVLTDYSDELHRYRLANRVDGHEVIQRLEEEGSTPAPAAQFAEQGHVDCSVPQEEQVRAGLNELRRVLSTIDERPVATREDLVAELGADVVTQNGLTEGESPKGAVGELTAAYLDPVRAEEDELAARLERLGSEYETDDGGLITVLDQLVRLANDSWGAEADGEPLPTPDGATDPCYGLDFTMHYEENHQLPSLDVDESGGHNAVRRTLMASTADLSGNPGDIGESVIWPNNRDAILRRFNQSIDDMSADRYARLPVDLGALHPSGDDTVSHLNELRIVNAYMSRVFEQTSATTGFRSIKDSLDSRLGQLTHANDGYRATRLDYGDPWTLSMVTFVSGFTLDMLEPATVLDGYKQAYEQQTERATYPWRHHSLGLAGDWDRWEMLADSVTAEENPEWWPHGGAYVRRDELLSPGEIAVWTKKIHRADDEIDLTDVVEGLNDAFELDTFESTL